MKKPESPSLTRRASSQPANLPPGQDASSRATPVRLIRRPELLRMTGLANSTLYHYMGQGRFPRPVKIGVRSVAWLEEDVVAWISGRPVADLRTEEAAG